VVRRAIALAEFAASRRVACYLSKPGEVPTAPLLRACRRAGKRVCVPAFVAAAGGYRFADLAPGGKRVAGPFGIPQPARIRAVDPRVIDLAFVPALAFDREGRRLGHGGGHFDRLLARVRGARVGLAFEWQVVPRVPAGARDRAMHVVVTEAHTYRRRGPSPVNRTRRNGRQKPERPGSAAGARRTGRRRA
jgi:5-formyltetrahydrofolate cyclo-ligase